MGLLCTRPFWDSISLIIGNNLHSASWLPLSSNGQIQAVVREGRGCQGLPGGASGKEPACQCRRHKRHRFHPRVGKIPWRRAQQPTPVFLSEESPGQRSLVGYSPWGCKESDMTDGLACTHGDARPERNKQPRAALGQGLFSIKVYTQQSLSYFAYTETPSR